VSRVPRDLAILWFMLAVDMRARRRADPAL